MCGIVGLIDQQHSVDERIFTEMRDALIHRGPDDAGSHFFLNRRVALGHRRLSFLDLSFHGRQPLSNEDGSVWVTFNGEIYNYKSIRAELEVLGHRFASHTDTEVLVHAYESWGAQFVARLNGMFAFAIFDLKQQKLFLARDRYGIKPLYWTIQGSRFAFASELKALLVCPHLQHTIAIDALADYLNYRYVPSPKCIWQEFHKLAPAHHLTYDINSNDIKISEYWRPVFARHRHSKHDLAQHFRDLFAQAVCSHAQSDVPIGSFLSGGYDSSSIVYQMVQLGLRPDTFSIGFEDWEESEHRYATIVAESLDLSCYHNSVSEDTLDLLSVMPDVYDEPIADISILPTWLVCRLASSRVKAVMSGEGADEIFGGYWWQMKIFNHQSASPLSRLSQRLFYNRSMDIVRYYADAMAMGRFDKNEMLQAFQPSLHPLLPDQPDWFYQANYDPTLTPFRAVQRLDLKCFMAELVLVKVDRASMAHSLEVRVPFLDHELQSFFMAYRESTYIDPALPKYPIYTMLKRVMPASIVNRPKQGFVGPDEHYSTFNLYQKLLGCSQLVHDGIIRHEYISLLFANSDFWRLWKLFILEQWYRRWI